MIDSAFDLYLSKPPRSGVPWRTGGPPVEAARLALHAQACGYPDMRGIVDRVLALRLTPGSETRNRAAMAAAQVESTVATARLLALIDRGVARELLLGAEPHARLIGGSGNPADHGLWLQAWALTDLERAEQLYNQELAAQGPRAYPDLIESGLLPMLELLAEPPADRARFILSGDPYRQLYFWFPEES